ncbi:tRNA guanosine(15) transglycosylase TgtA [Hyperthermus butylicus]|uniref:tRNA-guanine(15) transglycosylase n=1 Tax=Hyperthermus butylicus (strain DSM 5456 / JCM 9403 / PLM1-5) TaxID=415426 RepID=A2BK22_HYPBU|nr:tRNA guanosine(15) transglycosylase TgtA [Hyperthermus butylicus]ABM80333.1 Queuine/archaeosine tRNA-ribosyltransferase [Hyperthermus butylicus DSM 5456]
MKREIGVFEIREKDLAGRIARLYTPHGVLETPALLPVIDPVRQEVPLVEIKRLGFNAVITNAYLLWKRLGEQAAEKGVHGVLGFEGIVMTDSGAYQLLEYGHVEVEPREIVEYEKKIGSDIAVILDVPTGNTRDRKQAEESVRETLRRAEEAQSYIDPDKRIWTLPIQGGPFIDLVRESAEKARKLKDYKLYALGSPTVLLERYEYSTLLDMVFTARFSLPVTRPLHLFGAGHPMIIPFAVALGVDMFDSASYILYARDNRYMTLTKTYRLENLEYFPCSCPVCSRYTPQELREMPRDERVKLLALHNLYVLRQAINEVKTAIREGRLWELLEERSRAHPSLATAFAKFRQYIEKIEQLAPRVKTGFVRGLLLYGSESLYNPRVVAYRRSIRINYKPRIRGELKLIPVSPFEKPFTSSKLYRSIKKGRRDIHVVGYMLYLGPIPEELAETYPGSQFEVNLTPYWEVVEETARSIAEYVEANKANYTSIEIYYCQGDGLKWSRPVAEKTTELLRKRGVEVKLAELGEC